MVKGYQGESCKDAMLESIVPGEVIEFKEYVRRIKERGTWRDDTICQHLMARVVNLPPARFRWASVQPFLFLRGDGRYEIYDPKFHPQQFE